MFVENPTTDRRPTCGGHDGQSGGEVYPHRIEVLSYQRVNDVPNRAAEYGRYGGIGPTTAEQEG